MKRLTYYSMKGSENDGWYLKSGVSKQDAVDRLAAYENSKLEPEEIKSLQADVAPVRHGKWTEVQKENIWGDIIPVFECSLCGKYTFGTKGITEKSNYCPNCGARMDEEEQQ